MLKNNDKQIGFIYNQNKGFDKVIKGTKQIFEKGFTREKTGENFISINSIGKKLIDYKIYGNIYQKQYEGYNLINYIDNFISSMDGLNATLEEDGTIIVTGIPTKNYARIINSINITDLLEDGEYYTIWAENYGTDSNMYGQINATKINGGTAYYYAQSQKASFLVDKSIHSSYNFIYQSGTMSKWGTEEKTFVNKIMVYKGRDDKEFEPYVGGVKSPNPEYPQEIKNTGDLLLPNEYQQVEYIESTGSQYINTNINADSNLAIEMEFSCNDHSIQRNNGAIYNNGDKTYKRHHFSFNSATSSSHVIVYAGSSSVPLNLIKDFDENKHRILHDPYNKRAIADGIQYDYDWGSFDTELSYWLFGRNSNFDSTKSYALLKIYNCKMYYKNILVRHFVPCYKKENNIIGLYDIIENKFYENNGTGEFLKGPNIDFYKILATVRSENLFDFDSFSEKVKIGAFSGVWYDLKPNTSYTVSTNISSGGGNSGLEPTLDNPIANATIVATTDLNASSLSSDKNGVFTNKNKTLTIITGNSGKLYVGCRTKKLDTIKELNGYWLQINEGKEAKKYFKKEYNIILDRPLKRIGEYSDYIDFKNKKIIRNIDSIILNGTEDIVIQWPGTNKWWYSFKNLISKGVKGEGIDFCRSNRYIGNVIYSTNTNQGVCIIKNNKEIRIRYGSQDSVDNYKNWLTTHPVQIDYVLAAQEEESFECPELDLIEDLNIISIDSEISPSNFWIKYKSKI